MNRLILAVSACRVWLSSAPGGRALLVLGVALAACADTAVPTMLPLPAGYGDRLAGRSFTSDGVRHVLADLRHETLKLTFDVAAHATVGHAEVHFRPVETGVPFLVFAPAATAATLDGEPIQLATLQDPDGVMSFTSLGVPLAAGDDHLLVVDYSLSGAKFSATGVDFETRMIDVEFAPPRGTGSVNFFEAYGPSSIEADAFQLSLELELAGATAPHRLFANGVHYMISPGHWEVEFPAYFSTSSFFVRLTETPLIVRDVVYGGLDQDIPVTVYGMEPEIVDSGATLVLQTFQDMESTYGPYAHASFIADLSGIDVGMEHAGATFATLGSLSHEVCHSWFGRGVLPADGRSGWIDEGICTWRDSHYLLNPLPVSEPPVNLANFSIWDEATAPNPHQNAAAVMSEVDSLLAPQGGLRPVLRTLYTEWRNKAITTEQFLAALQRSTTVMLEPLFQRYVYGL